MSSLAWVVGAWSMLVSIVAPTPPEALETRIAANMGVDTNTPVETPEGASEGVSAFISAYTCQPVAGNPMNPCNTTRWGNNPHTHGAACPESWAWRRVLVEGVWYVCDDTPRHDFINGLPHIDLRLSTLAAAVRWGVQVKEVQIE